MNSNQPLPQQQLYVSVEGTMGTIFNELAKQNEGEISLESQNNLTLLPTSEQTQEMTIQSENLINSQPNTSQYQSVTQVISDPTSSRNIISYVYEDDSELRDLLIKWNLEHVYGYCLQNRINVSALKYMTPIFMEKFFSLTDMDLGTQIHFSHYLISWQTSTSSTVTSDISSAVSTDNSDMLPCTSTSIKNIDDSTDSCNFDITELLDACSQGKAIMDFYKQKKELNDGSRKILLDIIINHIIQKDIKWSVRLTSTIARKIKIHFPTEEESFYYMKEVGRSPMGSLYIKYYNTLRKMKNSGLKTKRAYNKTASIGNSSLTVALDEEKDIDHILEIIDKDNCDWAELEHHWLATTNYRVIKITNSDCTASILNDWKQYKKNMGFKLIDIDFKTLYPNAGSFVGSFGLTAPLLLKLLSEKIKDAECLDVLQEFQKIEHVMENTESCCLMYLLHAILIPTSKLCSMENNKRKITKFSIKDSQNSFMLIAETAQALDEKLNHQLAKNESIQPFIMVTGKLTNPKEILVYFDSIKYKFHSFCQAVDTCFKIFMLFNLTYPPSSTLVWTFIQKYYYEIQTKYDKNHPSINMLISLLKK